MSADEFLRSQIEMSSGAWNRKTLSGDEFLRNQTVFRAQQRVAFGLQCHTSNLVSPGELYLLGPDRVVGRWYTIEGVCRGYPPLFSRHTAGERERARDRRRSARYPPVRWRSSTAPSSPRPAGSP